MKIKELVWYILSCYYRKKIILKAAWQEVPLLRQKLQGGGGVGCAPQQAAPGWANIYLLKQVCKPMNNSHVPTITYSPLFNQETPGD